MKYYIDVGKNNVIISFVETDTPEVIPGIEQYKEITKEQAEEIKLYPNSKLKFVDGKIEVLEVAQTIKLLKTTTVDDVLKRLQEKEITDLLYQSDMELNILNIIEKIEVLEEKIENKGE